MAAPGQITGEKGEILMARLQIHTGLPDVSLDVIIPEFMKNRKAREQGLSREEYYASRNLPVLWLLHGGMGDATDWPRYSRIEMYAEEKGLIVVCPTGNNGNWVNMGQGKAGGQLHRRPVHGRLRRPEDRPEASGAVFPNRRVLFRDRHSPGIRRGRV